MTSEKPAVLTIRMPEPMRHDLKVAAAQAGVSLNSVAVSLLQEWLESRPSDVTARRNPQAAQRPSEASEGSSTESS